MKFDLTILRVAWTKKMRLEFEKIAFYVSRYRNISFLTILFY